MNEHLWKSTPKVNNQYSRREFIKRASLLYFGAATGVTEGLSAIARTAATGADKPV
jgi:hypothetical protein